MKWVMDHNCHGQSMTYLCEYCGTRFWGEHKCDKLPLHLRNWVNESSAEIKKDTLTVRGRNEPQQFTLPVPR